MKRMWSGFLWHASSSQPSWVVEAVEHSTKSRMRRFRLLPVSKQQWMKCRRRLSEPVWH